MTSVFACTRAFIPISVVSSHSFAVSPRNPRESCFEFLPLRNQRAQGMPGARCARSRACRVENTRVSHHGHTGITRHSPRNGFNGFLRALPGDRLVDTVASGVASADLTPAPRCQDHTTSPFALVLFVNSTAASTASRPASVTIASRPSVGRDRNAIVLICPVVKRNSENRKLARDPGVRLERDEFRLRQRPTTSPSPRSCGVETSEARS